MVNGMTPDSEPSTGGPTAVVAALIGVLRTGWSEPRMVAPPGITVWDRVLVAALVPVAVLEASLRTDMTWPWWHLGWALVSVAALLWRPHRPLAMLVLGYGAQTVAGVVPALAGQPYSVLNVTACVLLLAYSLGRWAGGRQVAAGAAFVLVAHLVREPLYDSSPESILVGVAALLFPITLGVAVRFWVRAQQRERAGIRLRERERLARDLHDTVAHHMTGLVLQARVARLTAKTDPDGADAALLEVEQAALRSLDEMRSLVGVLRREDDGSPRQPTAGLADLPTLADDRSGPPVVAVRGSDQLGEVSAAVGSALFRAAQESVANARRHADEATMVEVDLARHGDLVTMVVHDDGRGGRDQPSRSTPRWGLVGMKERFSLLGGQVSAGPDEAGGWTVRVVVPARVGSEGSQR